MTSLTTASELDPPQVTSSATASELDPPHVTSSATASELDPPQVTSSATASELDPPPVTSTATAIRPGMQPLQLKALHITEPSFSIPGYFDQLQDDVFAYRGSGTRFVDFTFALPREGCHLCSTLYKEAGDETWTILEWCDNIQAIEDLNAPLPSDGPCEIIVIASRKGIAPRDIGLQLIDDDVALTPVTVKAVMAFRHLSKSKPRLRPHCVMKPIRLMIPSLSTVSL